MTRREAERLQRLLAQGSPQGESARADEGAGGEQAHGELAELASLARTLESSAAQPGPRFPDALRERVLATADAEELAGPWRARVGTVVDDLVAAWRFAARSAVASGTLTLMLLLAGLFVGASLSLPGDPLYAIKDAYQKAQLSRASAPTDVASVKLDMASAKVGEMVRAAERNRPDSLATSAHDAESLVRDSAETLLSVYQASGDADVLVPLARFVDGHRTTVTGVRDRVGDAEADRALTGLIATLDGIDAEVTDILGRCCEPASEAGSFWTMSSPPRTGTDCPCLLEDGGLRLESAGQAGSVDILELAPHAGGFDDGTDRAAPPQRWRKRIREGVDETTEQVTDTTDQVTDTVDETTDDVTDTVDETTEQVTDTTEQVTDTVDETTDDVTDTVDETTGGATDSVTNGVDDTVEDATGALDDTVQEGTDRARGAVDDATDALDDAAKGVLGDDAGGTSDGSGDGDDGGGDDDGGDGDDDSGDLLP